MKRRVKAGLAGLIVILALTGCSSGDSTNNNAELEALRNKNEELIAMCETYIDTAEKYEGENKKLNEQVKSVTEMLRYFDEDNVKLAEYGSSVMLSDGAKAKLALNGMISLGSSIELESIISTDNKNIINIGDSVSMVPSANWTTKFKKDGLQLQHDDGIYGEVNVKRGVFTDTAFGMYTKYVDKLINDINATELERRNLFLNNVNAGYTVRTSINVIDGQAIIDWEEFVGKDANANKKLEEATTAEEELKALSDELEEMKRLNDEYNAALVKNDELTKANEEIKSRNDEALKKDANATLESLNELIDVTIMKHYTDEELNAKQTDIDNKSNEASTKRTEADEIRRSTPSENEAEQYFLEIGLLNTQECACYYYLIYKKVDYVSVSETVDTLIRSIRFNGVQIGIN